MCSSSKPKGMSSLLPASMKYHTGLRQPRGTEEPAYKSPWWEHPLPSPCQRGQRNRKGEGRPPEKDNTGYKVRLGNGSEMMLPASAVGEACTILVCPFICCSAGARCPKHIEGCCGVLVLPLALQAP